MAVTVSDLLCLLRLERQDQWLFNGSSLTSGAQRVYGGQMLGQSIMAMGQTVPEAHHLHSMQGYFLQPGDVQKTISFNVQPIRDGRNFSTRLLLACQEGRPIFSGAASFQHAEGVHRRLSPMPSVTPPLGMISEAEYYADELPLLAGCHSHTPLLMSLFERRSEHWRSWVRPGPRDPVNGIWCRLREPCGDDPLLCQALLAYVCDMDLMNTAMRPRGVGALDPSAHAASLDHAMWFHAAVQPDRWFYYDLAGPGAVNNRGLGSGSLYQDGVLVATAMQEGLLRESQSG
ncbi:acyl-CoA thioesterase [Pseudomonas bohemica]|uniref:acyl-CoA thioesterase n=1 Tax=Pseudomonas bohemica TaxID=2044872 RepID=UPI000DA5F5BF|nr:acyl-CoA thioesterase domain-containing protein [Pseudomonas bohemica]